MKENFPSYNLILPFLKFDFRDVMSVSNINPCYLRRMNTRRTICHRRGVATAEDNQVPPHAPPKGVAMPVNPSRLNDAEVRASLNQMAHAITIKAQSMTELVNQQNFQRENSSVYTMADRLRDFTRMNPPIFTLYKTPEDPKEFVDEVHKIFVSMGCTYTKKAELASYQRNDVAQTW